MSTKKHEAAYKLFCEAIKFTKEHHLPDFKWILARQSLTLNFNELFEEFCYVIVASGFKGKTAAVLAPQLAKQSGDLEKMKTIFKNIKKISSIKKFYDMFRDDAEENEYTKINEEKTKYKETDVIVPKGISAKKFTNFLNNIEKPEDLVGLPYIGRVTCNHLSRNIGLKQTVKPDLHLNRMAEEYSYETPETMVIELKKKYNDENEEKEKKISLGCADFVLWVFLSHDQGKINDCCDGGYRLR